MASEVRLGAKVRAMRRRQKLTQVELADRLGISPSYLNLIEHNRRALTAPLLIKLASLFDLDLKTFAADDDERLVSDLMEVFADTLFQDHHLTAAEVRELIAHVPAAGRAVLTLYGAWRQSRETARDLAARVEEGGVLHGVDALHLPSEEVSDVLQRHGNHFAELETAADALRRDAGLSSDALVAGLTAHLKDALGVAVSVEPEDKMGGALRRFSPRQGKLRLSAGLSPRSRAFQLAHMSGLLTQAATIERLEADARLTSDEARTLCRVALANYFAGAVLMPYDEFLAAARAERYDIALLSHRFDVSFEQVCHRLTTLHRPGALGVPFHFLRVDIAGNLSKRFSASGIHFARFAGACPRWNVHAAFMTPGAIRTQVSTMPDGTTFFCIARTVEHGRPGYRGVRTVHAVGLGCRVDQASALVYADGLDLKASGVPVGITCRMCERMDCEQRAVPPLQAPLEIDENVRGLSFYAPATTD